MPGKIDFHRQYVLAIGKHARFGPYLAARGLINAVADPTWWPALRRAAETGGAQLDRAERSAFLVLTDENVGEVEAMRDLFARIAREGRYPIIRVVELAMRSTPDGLVPDREMTIWTNERQRPRWRRRAVAWWRALGVRLRDMIVSSEPGPRWQ
jgi:hypothetical protein